jgi:hypothetical protein
MSNEKYTSPPVRPSDAEIEALAVEHESFGFGLVDQQGYTTHGFSPDGLRSFVAALKARFGAQPAAPAVAGEYPPLPGQDCCLGFSLMFGEEKMRSYVDADRAMRDKWQPIETAKKDGNPFWMGNCFNMRVGFWKIDCWADFDMGRQLNFTPTHWMPLPQPPKD